MTSQELQELLRRVDREVAPLGVRDFLRLNAILDSSLARDRAELRAAVASALSRNREDWERIALRFDECVGQDIGTLATPGQLRESLDDGPPRPPPGSRLRGWLARRAPRFWLAMIVVVLAAMVGVALWYFRPPPPPLPAPVTPDTVEKKEPALPVIIKPYADERRLQVPWEAPPRHEPLRIWLSLAGISFVLSLLGLRWLFLPPLLRREQEERSTRERARLSEARLRSQRPLRPLYRVPHVLPLEPGAIEDAAIYLGRIFRQEHGDDLDVPGTLRLTLDAGGRFVPLFAPRRLTRELLVLLDFEKGDHPWLWGFLRILDEWEKRGVHLLRFRFAFQPGRLMSIGDRDGDLLTLDDLGRRHEGAALLVISRKLSPRGLDGEAGWLDELSSWPLRAWLDPDPRPEEERTRAEKRDLARLRAAGLPRFPFTRDGLVLLGRHFAAEGVGVTPPAWPALPRVEDLSQQLELLATVAAMVPDPTWEQIEGFRRLLADDLPLLEFPGYVQRLIEWMRQRMEDDPEGEVRTLLVPHELVATLLHRLLKQEGQGGRIGPRERRIRELLIAELDDEDEDGEPGDLRRWQRRLARARHEALLHMEKATELLAPFLGSPVEAEARHYLEPEIKRLPKALGFDGLRQLLLSAGGLRLAELLLGGWRPAWPVLAAMMVGLWATAWWFGLARRIHAPEEQAEMILPRIREVVRQVQPEAKVTTVPTPQPGPPAPPVPNDGWKKETPYRAAMVKISPGRFQMGSPESEEGHQADERQHSVRINRAFALAVTEVTQGQYRRVMGKNPSNFKGDSLPVENVSWFDAVDYCNKLSTLEGLKPCYQHRGEDVKWPGKLDCPGYRLPTEAEWEYAARSGKKTLYAGSDNLDEVAWYRLNSQQTTHPVKKKKKANGWGLYDMSGNVWEWVWDWYDEYPNGLANDPVGPAGGSNRVSRGGSWVYDPILLRVANRYRSSSGIAAGYLGFRLSRSLP